MLSIPKPKAERTMLSTGISACRLPEVPKRMKVKGVCTSLGVLCLKSILKSASSSLRTISMLSGPIPVETTEIRLPPSVGYKLAFVGGKFHFVKMGTHHRYPLRVPYQKNCRGDILSMNIQVIDTSLSRENKFSVVHFFSLYCFSQRYDFKG